MVGAWGCKDLCRVFVGKSAQIILSSSNGLYEGVICVVRNNKSEMSKFPLKRLFVAFDAFNSLYRPLFKNKRLFLD